MNHRQSNARLSLPSITFVILGTGVSKRQEFNSRTYVSLYLLSLPLFLEGEVFKLHVYSIVSQSQEAPNLRGVCSISVSSREVRDVFSVTAL